VHERVSGAYIMPPFGRHALALDVIDGIVTPAAQASPGEA